MADRVFMWGGCAGLGFALTGCLATAQLQEPGALPPGEWEVSAAAGGLVLQDFSAGETVAAPGAQATLRVGVVDALEVFAVGGSLTGLLLGAKYQVLGDYGGEGAAVSLSLDSNLTPLYFSVSSGGTLQDFNVVTLNTRGYLGWTWSGGASVFAAPGVNLAYGNDMGVLFPALALGGRSTRLPVWGGDIQLCGEVAGVYKAGGVLLQAMAGIAF